ncbi:HNH endonuclease signature motif containing protein [Bdellovibrio sp.]|uniref:HNH endonuclease n=1 Tax=Bdellovibrio TaxID=958 RepID=UPI003221D60D
MSLQNISNDELIKRMEKLVRGERKITHLVLLHILEIEERKIFAELGFDSMYSYLTQKLGYSESAAYRRLQSARLLKKVPTLAEKIEDGRLNLSQLTQVQKCLKQQSQKTGTEFSTHQTLQVLEQIENKNNFATEQVLAVAFDLSIQIRESLKPQKDESVRIELTLSKEQFTELEQAQSLLSHICPEGTWADVIGYLAQNFNKRKLQGKMPTTKAPRIATSSKCFESQRDKPPAFNSTITQSFAATELKYFPKRPRKYISVNTRRELLKKASNCCEYQNPTTGQRCQSRYQLQVEHIQPWALGGSNHISNLKTLCRTHNNLSARRSDLQK